MRSGGGARGGESCLLPPLSDVNLVQRERISRSRTSLDATIHRSALSLKRLLVAKSPTSHFSLPLSTYPNSHSSITVHRADRTQAPAQYSYASRLCYKSKSKWHNYFCFPLLLSFSCSASSTLHNQFGHLICKQLKNACTHHSPSLCAAEGHGSVQAAPAGQAFFEPPHGAGSPDAYARAKGERWRFCAARAERRVLQAACQQRRPALD